MRFFHLTNRPITSNEIQHLENGINNHPEIENVTLNYVTFQNKQDFKRLIRFILARPSIRSITLAGIQLPENPLETLCSVLNRLEKLTIEHCIIDSQEVLILPEMQNPHLKELCISNLIAPEPQYNQVLTSISSFPELDKLNLGMNLGVFKHQLPEILTACQQLSSLDLTSAVIDEECLDEFLASIEQHPTIKELQCDAAVSNNYTNLPETFFEKVNAVLERNLDKEPFQIAPRIYSLYHNSLRGSPTLSEPRDFSKMGL